MMTIGKGKKVVWNMFEGWRAFLLFLCHTSTRNYLPSSYSLHLCLCGCCSFFFFSLFLLQRCTLKSLLKQEMVNKKKQNNFEVFNTQPLCIIINYTSVLTHSDNYNNYNNCNNNNYNKNNDNDSIIYTLMILTT